MWANDYSNAAIYKWRRCCPFPSHIMASMFLTSDAKPKCHSPFRTFLQQKISVLLDFKLHLIVLVKHPSYLKSTYVIEDLCKSIHFSQGKIDYKYGAEGER